MGECNMDRHLIVWQRRFCLESSQESAVSSAPMRAEDGSLQERRVGCHLPGPLRGTSQRVSEKLGGAFSQGSS